MRASDRTEGLCQAIRDDVLELKDALRDPVDQSRALDIANRILKRAEDFPHDKVDLDV